MRLNKYLLISIAAAMIITSCSSTSGIFGPTATETRIPETVTPQLPTDTPLPTSTFTLEPSKTPSETPTTPPSDTPTITPTATSTETFTQLMKNRIIFYLLIPEKGRQDACGTITEVPIISKRIRTGDKLQDVQIALNMLFTIGRKLYGPYYNALWNTNFKIKEYQYNKQADYMTITFVGYFPFTMMDGCDKHGIRQQIWTTFFHYGFKEKTFKYYDKFLIDKLGGH